MNKQSRIENKFASTRPIYENNVPVSSLNVQTSIFANTTTLSAEAKPVSGVELELMESPNDDEI